MASLRLNILANYAAQAIAAVVGFVVVPVYLRLLGAEGYGVIGFLLSLQAMLVVLDFGLSTTANREISRSGNQVIAPNVFRTLEWVYGLTAVMIFVTVALSSEYLAFEWINAKNIPQPVLRECMIIAGMIVGLRWPVAIYAGMLRGLEQQVKLNVLTSLFTIARAAVGVAVLVGWAQNVKAYFWSQLVVSIFELLMHRLMCVRFLPKGQRGVFSRTLLSRIWSFSWRVAGISLFAVVLKQIDRLAVSKLLSLEQLGYYNTAIIMGTGLARVYNPVQTAVFPRLGRLLAAGADAELIQVFHRSAQLVAFMATPLAAACIFFAPEILWLWTQNAEVAEHAAAPLRIYAGAMLLNSLMSVPYALQLAAGMTWLPLWTNIAGVVLLCPLAVWFVNEFGLAGGALAWLIFNICYVLVVPQILFRHMLAAEKRSWYLRDGFCFVICGLVGFGCWRVLFMNLHGRANMLLVLAAAGTTYMAVVLWIYPHLRTELTMRLRSVIDKFLP